MIYIYVSRYNTALSKGGIDVFNLDDSTGEVINLNHSIELNNPSYININKNYRTLYSTIKESSDLSEDSGKLSSFSIDKDNGKLTKLSETSSMGKSPVFITVKNDNSFITTANYRGGSLVSFPIKDGYLKESAFVYETFGSGFLKDRQNMPYPHFTTFSHSEEYLLTVYLGLDTIKVHSFDKNSGKLYENEYLNIKVSPGCGPRHLILSNDDKYLYILTELSSEILVYKTNDFKEPFTLFQTISTLPDDFNGKNNPAAIYLSKDGRFLYASNRGHDSIAVFNITLDGSLKSLSHTDIHGENPRDFSITEDGNFLIAANQTSGNITTFKIDKSTGLLKFTGNSYKVPNAICVQTVIL